ncbi:MAG: hypothetical protein K9G46_06955 [Flavobacteriales bacterium]|nr:hypothetical protein [Flavobacteriales bacterium]
MITFYSKKQGDIYECESVRSFATFRSEIRENFTGNRDELRHQLRKEYRTHADLLVLMFLDYSDANKSSIAREEMQKLEDIMQLHLATDHVRYSRDLLTVDFTRMLKPGAEAYGFSVFMANSLEFIANGEKSLWVRGEIELIDGTIVEPWKLSKDERAAA